MQGRRPGLGGPREPRRDELGIGTISAGGTIAWAMCSTQCGLIGVPWLRFGDVGALPCVS